MVTQGRDFTGLCRERASAGVVCVTDVPERQRRLIQQIHRCYPRRAETSSRARQALAAIVPTVAGPQDHGHVFRWDRGRPGFLGVSPIDYARVTMSYLIPKNHRALNLNRYYQLGLAPAASPPLPPPSPPPISPWKVGFWALLGVGAIWAIHEGSLTTRERHDREVKRAAKEKLREGFDVAADIAGWPKPPVTNGRRVDVFAMRGRSVKMIEIEHEHTLDTSHTRAQINDLADFCDTVDSFDCELEVRLT